jgi:acetyltransferase-like isoleucine patch superfamily enzyme
MSAESMKIIENCEIGEGTDIAEFNVIKDCIIGKDTTIWRFNNLYGCSVGDNCMIGSLVEIQSDVDIASRCRIQSHAFLCSLLTVESDVFISHGAKFVNDRHPPSGAKDQWEETTIKQGAAIGTNATVLPVEIGQNSLVGAGAVVTEDVPENAIVGGNPAEIIGYTN